MADCRAISTCNSLVAVLDCLEIIHQGENKCINIQLLDSDGEPLDLDSVDAMVICLYTYKFNYETYCYPVKTDSECEEIEFLQEEGTDGEIIDEGLIRICISSELSSRFLTGPIFAEIKIKYLPEETGGYPTYKVINCLKIGHVVESLTRDINNF